jgi:predicted transcriptional regulator
MDEYIDKQLTVVLKAISDSTRRSLLTKLMQQGPMRVTELAAHYEMSLNSISKHIKVLESADLISRTTAGRVHIIQATPNSMQCINNWLQSFRSIWEMRLDTLTDIMEQESNNEPSE